MPSCFDIFFEMRRDVFRPREGQSQSADVTLHVDDLSPDTIDRAAVSFMDSMEGLVVGYGKVYFTFVCGNESVSITRRMPIEDWQKKRVEEINAEEKKANRSFFDRFFGEK